MGRKRKLTKRTLLNALLAARTVTGAAQQLGVDRRTVQRSLGRYGIRFDALLGGFTALSEPASTNDAPILEVASRANPTARKATAEANILRPKAADFSGRWFGDAGRGSRAATAEEQIARYRRLRGY